MTIQEAWNECCRLHDEGDKLHKHGDRLRRTRSGLSAEENKLHAIGDKLAAEGNLLFINAVIEMHGPECMIDYKTSDSVVVNGEMYVVDSTTIKIG